MHLESETVRKGVLTHKGTSSTGSIKDLLCVISEVCTCRLPVHLN